MINFSKDELQFKKSSRIHSRSSSACSSSAIPGRTPAWKKKKSPQVNDDRKDSKKARCCDESAARNSSESLLVDFGAIEAALKETARGRAFLASCARRVQPSDTSAVLATLGRLERLLSELASRMAELELAAEPRASQPVYSNAGLLQQRHPQGIALHAAVDPMHIIDELASMLDHLHHHAVHLASMCGGDDAQSVAVSAVEIDLQGVIHPDPSTLSTRHVATQDITDEDLLGKIAKALEP